MPEIAAAVHALLEGLDGTATVLELDAERTDLTVLAVNAVLAAHLDRPAQELIGRSGRALYAPAAFAEVLSSARTASAERRVITFEAVRELPTGRSTVERTLIPLDGNRVVAFARDVSQGRQALRQLEVVERSARIGSWQWNIADDRLSWSDEYRRILGLDAHEEPSFGYLRSVVHPEDWPRVRAGVDRVAGGGPASSGVRFRIRRPDGEFRTVEGRGELAHDSTGRVVRMSGTIQDVTEQVETERRERQIADADRRQRQAMEVNDDIVQGLAAIWLALELGRIDEATALVARTTQAAQDLVANLLRGAVDEEVPAGTLIRGLAAVREPVDP
jgi:PAS domain S-box-containing protein